MKILSYLKEKIVLTIGKIEWKTNKVIPDTELIKIHNLLEDNYCIILTRRSNHLSTFFVGLADFLLTCKWGYWSHVLMNLEDELKSVDDFRLVEATGTGVHYTPFEKVFNVQSVAILKPKTLDLEKWTSLVDVVKLQIGKPYDTMFNIKDSSKLSCIELIRVVLQHEPNYYEDFKNFEKLIHRYKNISPQMLFNCGDFDIVYLLKV